MPQGSNCFVGVKGTLWLTTDEQFWEIENLHQRYIFQ